jgi:hypothetical protein
MIAFHIFGPTVPLMKKVWVTQRVLPIDQIYFLQSCPANPWIKAGKPYQQICGLAWFCPEFLGLILIPGPNF